MESGNLVANNFIFKYENIKRRRRHILSVFDLIYTFRLLPPVSRVSVELKSAVAVRLSCLSYFRYVSKTCENVITS